jgi:hypothetical protein
MNNLIDFDTASNEWRKNKKYIGKRQFVYLCNYIHTKTEKPCQRTIVTQLPNFYMMDFGGINLNYRIIYHPNKDIFCKRHLNHVPY